MGIDGNTTEHSMLSVYSKAQRYTAEGWFLLCFGITLGLIHLPLLSSTTLIFPSLSPEAAAVGNRIIFQPSVISRLSAVRKRTSNTELVILVLKLTVIGLTQTQNT